MTAWSNEKLVVWLTVIFIIVRIPIQVNGLSSGLKKKGQFLVNPATDDDTHLL